MSVDVVDEPGEGVPDHERIGPYRLVQRLGEGGMGVVHLALDRKGKAVAIKLLRPHIAHDESARARLSREVETLSRITSPRVAPILDADVEGDRPYIVTQYIAGSPLDDVVKESGPLAASDLHRLGCGLADALDVIHGAGVVHRDLKPGNVMLRGGEPILIDFGIAHVVDEVRLTMTGLVMGTPGYLAPEVVQGDPVTTATDWWGWAATVAFAASGRPPFGKGRMEAVLARVATGEADLDGVDQRITPLLYAALSPRMEERPHQREVVAGLERFARGGDVTDVIDLRREAPPTERVGVRGTAVMPQPRPAPTRPVGHSGPPPVSPPIGMPQQRQPVRSPQRPTTPHQPVPARQPVPAGPASPPQGMPAHMQPAARQPLAFHGQHPQQQQALLPWGPVPAPPVRQGWGPSADPRIGRPSRAGTLALLLLLVVVAGAAAPALTVGALLLATVVARTVDRTATGLVVRRHRNGIRDTDVPYAVASVPMHILVAVLTSIASMIMPVVVGASAMFAAALAVASVTGGEVRPNTAIPLAAAGLCGTLMAWWGPGGTSLRRGARSIVRGVAPGMAGASILGIVVLAAAGAVVLWSAGRDLEPYWWPLREWVNSLLRAQGWPTI